MKINIIPCNTDEEIIRLDKGSYIELKQDYFIYVLDYTYNDVEDKEGDQLRRYMSATYKRKQIVGVELERGDFAWEVIIAMFGDNSLAIYYDSKKQAIGMYQTLVNYMLNQTVITATQPMI